MTPDELHILSRRKDGFDLYFRKLMPVLVDVVDRMASELGTQ